MATKTNRKLSAAELQSLLKTLRNRFEKNMSRHKKMDWTSVQARLESAPEKCWSLNEMEKTGGEPDVAGQDKKTGAIIFFDCAPESPSGRRSLCYDPQALKERKENKPGGSAMGMATDMGIEMLTEEQYRELQQLGEFDLKTSSWLKTPEPVRKLGGSIFGDRRYDQVFIYHNGAQSYYAARGFRGCLMV